MNNYYLKRRKT